MSKKQNPVVMTEEDYNLIKPIVDTLPDAGESMSLAHEINRAVIVKKDAFPANTVRLNSKVAVLDLGTDRVIEFKLVMPEKADMKLNKVSVITPIGAALIGFRKGEEVQWKVPAGLKRFRILDVVNI